MGKAPLLIGLFAISGFQILFLGLLGEYINIILIHVRNLPLVVEKGKIEFLIFKFEKLYFYKLFINFNNSGSFIFGLTFSENSSGGAENDSIAILK